MNKVLFSLCCTFCCVSAFSQVLSSDDMRGLSFGMSRLDVENVIGLPDRVPAKSEFNTSHREFGYSNTLLTDDVYGQMRVFYISDALVALGYGAGFQDNYSVGKRFFDQVLSRCNQNGYVLLQESNEPDDKGRMLSWSVFQDGKRNRIFIQYTYDIEWLCSVFFNSSQVFERAKDGVGSYEYWLGRQMGYFGYTSLPFNAAQSREWILSAANHGFADAQILIGGSILFGHSRYLNFGDNLEEGFRWIKMAADQGSAVGLVDLSNAYKLGRGCTPNAAQAFKYAEMAAKMGSPMGMLTLAECFDSGIGVKPDEKKAYQWYLKAAEAGDAIGMNMVGSLLLYSNVIPKDPEKAFEWYNKAYQTDSDPPFISTDLGRCYMLGYGCEIDAHKGVELFLEGANKGSSEAMYLLGVTYTNGYEDIKPDREAGKKWLIHAIEAGSQEAQDFFDRNY